MVGGIWVQALRLSQLHKKLGVSLSNSAAGMTNRQAEYQRRQDEWTHQANLATIELKQIDQQSTAAQIRLAIAEQELRNHDQQIGNAKETDQFLRNKFTNQDLFSWMAGQVSGLYFQSYQLAYDFAKRAEVSMQHRARPGGRRDLIHPLRLLGFAQERTSRRRPACL